MQYVSLKDAIYEIANDVKFRQSLEPRSESDKLPSASVKISFFMSTSVTMAALISGL